ncbi:MAG TPA: cupin domain-containing protein [Chthonomonadaceae bacterium]|nr:cupin domain-containing protein [Chthonomonadaceae bacterium]
MEVINRNAVTAFTTKDTSTIREILAPRNARIERQSLAEATLAAGAATQAHFHPRTEEIYYILRGAALMAVEGERRAVGPGDAIGILPGQRHQIRNVGEGDLVFLCCCVPAYEDADTVMCAPLLEE